MPALPGNSDLRTETLLEPEGVRMMLRGELDMNGVLATERAVEAATELVPSGRLTIDLAELDFMDLFGARALLRVADGAVTPRREVIIVNPKGHVRRLFELITDLSYGHRNLLSELVREAG
jgi:anti-anti-sigma factor